MLTDFSKIVFDPLSHTYTYGKRRLISVTTILKWITPEFDTESMLKKQSYKTGRSIEEIRKEWDAKRDEGLDKGTRVHNYVENVMDGHDVECMQNINEYIHEMKQFDIAWNKLRNKLKAKMEYKEYTVGDAELGVAGRIDAIISLHLKDKQRNCIFDWKTGKFMTRKYARENMLPPFDDLPCCEEVKYSIQLSMYRLIFERNIDTEIHSSYIMHLPSDGDYQLYNAIDYRDRLEKWLIELNKEGKIGDPEADKQMNKLLDNISKNDLRDIKIISPHTRSKLYDTAKNIMEMCEKYS